jgi:hypothetical protein
MTAAPRSAQPVTEQIAEKIPFLGKIQNLVYGAILSAVAVGIPTAIYVITTQGVYFGKSFKYTWDNLDKLWHVSAIPLIGDWMVRYWDVFRHLFLRDDPEPLLAFALVAVIVVKQLALKDKTPLIDRFLLIPLHMPSRYQSRYTTWRGRRSGTAQFRRADPSLPQILLLPLSILVAAIPGEAVASAIIFPALAFEHSRHQMLGVGPETWWVIILIGVAGGAFAGHSPAVAVGEYLQRYFLGRRLLVAYAAEKIMTALAVGWSIESPQERRESLAIARDQVTAMRSTHPSVVYPPAYRIRYDDLLIARYQPRPRGKVMVVSTWLFVAALLVLAVYGLYVKYIGLKVLDGNFWKP